MSGLIGEVSSTSETNISTTGKVTYVSQTPFILNATLRDNILFGLPYDEEWYNRVLDDCCLRTDLQQLGAAGDMTEIGERGVTLSGGQKQRVSIARAVYGRPDVILMDDPISALDAGTAKNIFSFLIKSETNSILSNSAIVLVTHASHFLNKVDKIMVIVDGLGKFQGSWADLSVFEAKDIKTNDAIDFIRSSVQESTVTSTPSEEDGRVTSKLRDFSLNTEQEDTKKGKLMSVETREYGLSSLKTWFLWFKYAGGVPFLIIQFVLMTADRFAYVATEFWLAQWTQGAYDSITVFGVDFAPQSDGFSAQYEYLKVYALIILSGAAFTLLRYVKNFVCCSNVFTSFTTMGVHCLSDVIESLCRSEWAVAGGTRCANSVFQFMVVHVLKAPLSYFESTPLGRILNRFTYDMEVIDLTLTESMSILMIASSWFVASVTIMITIMPWIAFALVPGLLLYWMLLLHYRRSGIDLQRIDAVARSPIQAMVSEGRSMCIVLVLRWASFDFACRPNHLTSYPLFHSFFL